MRRLTHLTLSKTAVTDAGLAGFSNRPGLRYLSLLNTGVTDAGLLHLRVCTGLVYLNLQNTRVTARGVAALQAALPGCRVDHGGPDADRVAAELLVSLGGVVHVNNDTKSSITNSAGLPGERFALTHVALESSRAGDADLAGLKGCQALVFVHLAHLPVTDEGVSNVAAQQGLLYLHLGGTKVTDAGLSHFRGQRGLKGLYVNGTGVGVGLANFTECKDLSYLHVGDTAVADADLAGFKGHTALVSLYANNTKISDIGLVDLEGCIGLTHLDIRGTRVTREGVERFGHAVPRCRVVWDGGVVEPRK